MKKVKLALLILLVSSMMMGTLTGAASEQDGIVKGEEAIPFDVPDTVEPTAIQYVEGYNDDKPVSTLTYSTPSLWMAILYKPTVTYDLKKVSLVTGLKTGSVTVQLRPDSSGWPGTPIIRQVTFSMSSTVSWQGAEFSTSFRVFAGNTYWICWKPVAGSRASIATSGTIITHAVDPDGDGIYDNKFNIYPWMARFYKEVPLPSIRLDSRQDTGATSNLGRIKFDVPYYNLPATISKAAGTYAIDYQEPAGYKFVRWERGGGVSVANPNLKTTTATVTGDGSLRAIYKASNRAPIADADGPYSGDEGSPMTVDASGSYDPDGDPLQYRWDFDNDGVWDTAWSTSPTAAHTYGDEYIGLVELEVTDGDLSDTDTASATVNNVPPTVEAGPDQTVDEGDTVSFSGSFTDPGWLDTHTAEWDWGDGSPVEPGAVTEENLPPDATGTVTGSHVYGDSGVYTVVLTVRDNDGGQGSDTLKVTVQTVAQKPVIYAYAPWLGAAYKTFNLDNDVYCRGDYYQPNDKVDVYLVRDVAVWQTGIKLGSLSVVRLLRDVQIDGVGNLQSTLLWPAPLVAGVYDLVADVDQDGFYTEGVDALEDNGVVASLAGMFAIPELPLGTLMALTACLAAIIVKIKNL